jgi:hypothetical protein
MAIENLGIAKIAHRVWTAEGWGDDEPSCSEGHLVTAAVRETVRVAHAREDALLEALKNVANCLNDRMDVLRAEKLIRDIEATR